ncbi:hypothetical protein [Deinococcus cellulosilyticus]|nr:hypothetical protein [Deinococcus cellulosilyticus]
MKRSAQISLVVLASVTLTACSNDDESRMQYRSMQDCIDDWGAAELCERSTDSGISAAYFLGPYFIYKAGKYYYKRTSRSSYVPAPVTGGLSKPGISSRSTGTVIRGGFGGSKSSSSS